MEPAKRDNSRWISLGWTLLLVPFLLLPYRWIAIPCGLAGMLVAWPGRRTLRATFSRHGTLIAGSLAVLLARTALDVAYWLPWAAVMAGLVALRGSRWWSRRLGLLITPAVLIAAIALLLRPHEWPIRYGPPDTVSSSLTIVCAGDSLTSGVKPGTDADTYVASLRERLGCRVINAGVANDRTADLLARLDRSVLAHQPDIVLLFIGGNDYLDGTPRDAFAESLDRTAARIAAAGARLVVVEVPSGIIWNRHAGLYRQVARRYNAILVPETRLRGWYSVELLFRDHLAAPLTLDGIHLSPAGAVRVAEWLEPYLIRADQVRCSADVGYAPADAEVGVRNP